MIYPTNLREIGDRDADAAFDYIKSNREAAQDFYAVSSNAALEKFQGGSSALSLMVSNALKRKEEAIHTIQGAKFFEKYAFEIFTVLGLYSLPYCYAGANGARVLVQSRKIMEEPERRLLETGWFVFEACRVGAFEPEGNGLVAILKVRMMHAAARYYAASKIQDEIPVNQEDMLATLLAFSLITLRGLRKLGISYSDEEGRDFMKLWRFIGHWMGVDSNLTPDSIRSAAFYERTIRKKEFRQSSEGIALTKSLVDYLNTQESPELVGPADLMYYLLGNELSKLLGVKPKNIISGAALGNLLKTRNFFRSFSDTHFPKLVKQVEEQISFKGGKPDFSITY